MSIKAEIIADSSNSKGNRLTTFVLDFPRIVLAELNTHRMLSKNSASSRAIPFETMVEMVKTNPFIPIKFQKDHKGMQGTEYYEDNDYDICVEDWLKARDRAIESTQNFRFPITKQLKNRILEPFLMHKVILSGTEFENFFALRAHKDAEIHISDLAEKMLKAYNNSTPKQLSEGEWHIPFGDKMAERALTDWFDLRHAVQPGSITWKEEKINELKRKVAIARCARVSYFTYEGKDDYGADIKLCDRLFGNTPKHLSPTEHVASAMSTSDWCGNFRGWKQYRKYFSDENLTDPRIIKK